MSGALGLERGNPQVVEFFNRGLGTGGFAMMSYEAVFFVWVICGIGAFMIARSKGRSGCGWATAGCLIGPLAILIVGFMEPRS